MKLILGLFLTLFLPIFITAQVKVNGYYRKNGTYVEPHYRSSPDGNPKNNYSYPGNINPYTGKKATGSEETYLKRYDKNVDFYSGSLYYNPFGDIFSDIDFNLDFGYEITRYSMAGGYIVMGFNKFKVGIDGGAANMMGDMNLYNQVMGYNDLYNVFDYSYYLSGLVGYGNLFIGIGQNVYSDYTNNDMLYSIGFLSHIKKISLKLGVMHSNSLGPQFNVGIGLHIK